MYIVKVLKNKELNVNSVVKMYLTTVVDGTQYKVNGGFWGITANALLVGVYHLCNLFC